MLEKLIGKMKTTMVVAAAFMYSCSNAPIYTVPYQPEQVSEQQTVSLVVQRVEKFPFKIENKYL